MRIVEVGRGHLTLEWQGRRVRLVGEIVHDPLGFELFDDCAPVLLTDDLNDQRTAPPLADLLAELQAEFVRAGRILRLRSIGDGTE